tara:strand:+ start:52 stop:528 length:477 start_codon:yes stop_codon:yes gene_type:complete
MQSFISGKINITGYKKIIDGLVKKNTSINLSDLSTKGKNSKQFFLDDFSKLEKISNDIQFFLNKKLKLIRAWTVYGRKGSYHTIHRHNEKHYPHLATVIYLKVPKKEPGDFTYILNEGYDFITPKEGDIFIFPIHIIHGTYPQGEGLRQTLNLDFEIL